MATTKKKPVPRPDTVGIEIDDNLRVEPEPGPVVIPTLPDSLPASLVRLICGAYEHAVNNRGYSPDEFAIVNGCKWSARYTADAKGYIILKCRANVYTSEHPDETDYYIPLDAVTSWDIPQGIRGLSPGRPH